MFKFYRFRKCRLRTKIGQKKKKYITVERSEIIKLYNKNMGGVDKIDQLIAYYHIFIKSKKWTLRMIFHAIDMAMCNSWLEYLEDCTKLGVFKKKRMDLLKFRMRLADNLINFGRYDIAKKPRGQPSTSTILMPSPTIKKNKATGRRPNDEVCYDNVGHMPGLGPKLSCKKEGCSAKTHVVCKNFNVNLYFVVNFKNCFSDFDFK